MHLFANPQAPFLYLLSTVPLCSIPCHDPCRYSRAGSSLSVALCSLCTASWLSPTRAASQLIHVARCGRARSANNTKTILADGDVLRCYCNKRCLRDYPGLSRPPFSLLCYITRYYTIQRDVEDFGKRVNATLATRLPFLRLDIPVSVNRMRSSNHRAGCVLQDFVADSKR